MGITITRYEPRNGPPQWVLCVNGRVERVSDDLVTLAHEVEDDLRRRQDQDGSRA